MTQEPKNLWGNLPSFNKIKTPLTILKEQASLLTKMTQGLLVGEVTTQPKKRQVLPEHRLLEPAINPDFEAILKIRVPSLNHYTYSVVQVIFPMVGYPVTVKDLTTQTKNFQCDNEEGFEYILEKILSSEVVQKVISTLLASIQADELVNGRELIDKNEEQS